MTAVNRLRRSPLGVPLGLLALAGIAGCSAAGGSAAGIPPGSSPPARGLIPLSELAARPGLYQDRQVLTEGIVTSVCPQEGCFINLVPLSGEGRGVFVSAKLDGPKFPTDCAGQLARVEGRFYRKIYPRSRMAHWHGHGWRAGEAVMPPFAEVLRIDARTFSFRPPEREIRVAQEPLVPSFPRLIDLRRHEFEAARTGVRRQCLVPGERTPWTKTRRYHQLILALDQPLALVVEGQPRERTLGRDQATYLPARTSYRVRNDGARRACYTMVYSLPEIEHGH